MGTVDKFASGTFGITFAGSSGQYVDMDGSTSDSGILTAKSTFNFLAGDTVTLSFDYTGNQRTAASIDTLAVTFDPFFSSFIAIGQNAFGLPFQTYTNSVVVASDVVGASLSFSETGAGTNDNIGVILDNVRIDVQPASSTIPVPASVWMTGSVIALLAWRGKARRRGD